MQLRQFLTITPHKLLLLLTLEITSIILHNLVSAALGIEEALFFLLATIVIPFYTIISIIFTTLTNRKPRK